MRKITVLYRDGFLLSEVDVVTSSNEAVEVLATRKVKGAFNSRKDAEDFLKKVRRELKLVSAEFDWEF